MQTLLSLALVATLAGATAPDAEAQTTGAAAPAANATAPTRPAAVFKKLTRADFDALLKNPAQVLIIDVRRPDELQSNGGFAAYLSIQAADLEKQLAFIPRDRRIITVSNRSARAGRAAELLTRNGFAVAGGIGALEYEVEGGTLVTIAAPATTSQVGTGR